MGGVLGGFRNDILFLFRPFFFSFFLFFFPLVNLKRASLNSSKHVACHGSVCEGSHGYLVPRSEKIGPTKVLVISLASIS